MFLDYTTQCGYGVKMPRLGTNDGKNAFFPLPPLKEQHRIVSKIESLFAVIDEIESNKLSLEQFIKQAKSKVLDLAIHGKLVPQDPNDEPASVLLERIKNEHKTKGETGDNSHYPYEVPESWVWCKLGEINSIARGGSPRPIKNYLTDSDDGINWIKIGDTEKGGKYIYATQEKIIKEGIPHSRYVEINDFLLTNSMSFGRPYILKTNGCIHDGWLVISIDKQTLDTDFMYYLLSSPFMYSQFFNSAVGSTVKNLKSETVQQTPFPLPPLLEQQRIVAKIEQIFNQLDTIEQSIKA
jgi:type I restriction enzyme S subunit